LVPETLPDLRDPEGQLLPRRGLHALEVDEDAASRLGPEVGDRGLVLDRPDERLEHQVEVALLADLTAAVRTAPRVQLVGARASLALLAVDQRVGEGRQVAGCLPDPRRHDDRGVDPDHVVALLDDRPPPGVLDVALQLDAERPVVPEAAEPAVDL